MGEKEAMKVHEYHNHELVSKLVSANPPYLYSSPAAPHNFFFSEMLRSFVQKRKAEEMNPMKLKPLTKKPRKSNLYQQTQQKPLDLESEWKKARIDLKENKLSTPAEPTQEPIPHFDLTKSFQNENEDPKNLIVDDEDSTINVDKDDNEDLPPPPPPANVVPWYQPPFYVDPLHFFIDLRVSGHIYDRKKDYLHQALKSNALTETGTWNGLNLNRPGSAFKIPSTLKESKSYSALNLITNSGSAINTTTTTTNQDAIISPNLSDRSIPKHFNYYDKNNPNNTTYVMQNLPEIYKKVYNKADDAPEVDKSSDEDVEVIFDLDVKLENKK